MPQDYSPGPENAARTSLGNSSKKLSGRGTPRSLAKPKGRGPSVALTGKRQPLGCRPELVFNGNPARLLLDQLRCVDQVRLVRKMGVIDAGLWQGMLLEMLA